MTRIDWECRVLLPQLVERQRLERRQTIRDGLADARRAADQRRYLDNCRVAHWMERFAGARVILAAAKRIGD